MRGRPSLKYRDLRRMASTPLVVGGQARDAGEIEGLQRGPRAGRRSPAIVGGLLVRHARRAEELAAKSRLLAIRTTRLVGSGALNRPRTAVDEDRLYVETNRSAGPNTEAAGLTL
jgi:hypothetical protein